MTIVIPDLGLRQGLESVINSPSLRKRAIDEKTLSSIRYLNLNSRNIKDLRGLEMCKNIEVLYLADNVIQDISPLIELNQLKLVDLSMNPHIRWRTLSKPLCSVEQLFLRSCELENDLVLELFPNVRQVSLFHNKIEHIEILYSLSQLEAADLLHNLIPVEELEIFYNQTGIGVMEKKQG